MKCIFEFSLLVEFVENILYLFILNINILSPTCKWGMTLSIGGYFLHRTGLIPFHNKTWPDYRHRLLSKAESFPSLAHKLTCESVFLLPVAQAAENLTCRTNKWRCLYPPCNLYLSVGYLRLFFARCPQTISAAPWEVLCQCHLCCVAPKDRAVQLTGQKMQWVSFPSSPLSSLPWRSWHMHAP